MALFAVLIGQIATQSQPTPEQGIVMNKYKGATCRGCWELGTACGKCEKCIDTKPRIQEPPMTDSFDIEEQQRFVTWLKLNGLYNELDIAKVMQKAHMVWAEQQRVIDQARDELESIKKALESVCPVCSGIISLTKMKDDCDRLGKLLGENNG